MAQTIVGSLALTVMAFVCQVLAYALPGWKYYSQPTFFEGIFLSCPNSWSSCTVKFTAQTLPYVFMMNTRDGTVFVTETLGLACVLFALGFNLMAVCCNKKAGVVRVSRVCLITLSLFAGFFISMGIILEANAGLPLLWLTFYYCYYLAIGAVFLCWLGALVSFLHTPPPITPELYSSKDTA